MAFPSVIVVPEPQVVPRQNIGAFLLLGVDKSASKETIEAAWAQRLIWSRKGLSRAPLEDVNWAREVLSDSSRRIQADAASFNLDTTDGVLRQLQEKLQGGREAGFACRPLDIEMVVADYTPPVEVPNIDELRRNLTLPEIPREVPAVKTLLEEFAKDKLDPWEVDFYGTT